MKTQLEEVLQQRMSRKQFLQYIGSGLLVVFGVSNVIKLLQPSGKQRVSNGYGSSVYGGPKK